MVRQWRCRHRSIRKHGRQNCRTGPKCTTQHTLAVVQQSTVVYTFLEMVTHTLIDVVESAVLAGTRNLLLLGCDPPVCAPPNKFAWLVVDSTKLESTPSSCFGRGITPFPGITSRLGSALYFEPNTGNVTNTIMKNWRGRVAVILGHSTNDVLSTFELTRMALVDALSTDDFFGVRYVDEVLIESSTFRDCGAAVTMRIAYEEGDLAFKDCLFSGTLSHGRALTEGVLTGQEAIVEITLAEFECNKLTFPFSRLASYMLMRNVFVGILLFA